ncbi:Beta-lactamase-like precursor [hydrothermal vent metagenome]|uniref:Beta-lactamase-like n=1 Tax=hydrothermal vent metagenome TaxID=652676 RepID=A0A1W1C3Z9_9ZZZZ
MAIKKIISIIILIQSLSLFAWELSGKSYHFEKITKNVFVMHGPLEEPNKINEGFMNNPALIIANKGLIVIDPGSALNVGRNVIKEIEKISTKPIIAVFNTHIHGDHWLGNQAIIEKYPNAKIYAHPEMIKQANSEEGASWVESMERMTEGLSKGTKIVAPTFPLKHQQNIIIDSEEFKIHHPTVKAHTNTDIMIEHINSKSLFLGDNDFVNRMGRFDESSSMLGNIKTLKYAQTLDIKNFIPGHGKTGNQQQALEPFLNYLLIMKKVVQKGYNDDLQDYEIRPEVVKALKDYKNWHLFNTNLGPQINKMFLEIEALDE